MDDRSYLRAGIITSTHGLKGEVKVYPELDDPGRFSFIKNVFLKGKGKEIPAEIESVKFFKNMVILKFKDIDDINDILPYRQFEVLAKREDIAELKENQYFEADLLGLTVTDKEEKELGVLHKVLHTPGNDVYVVKTPDGKEIMIPAVKQFVLSVDIEGGRIVTDPLPGMLGN